MDTSVIIAIVTLGLAVLINVVAVAFGYGRISQKVNDMGNHLSELSKDMKVISTKVARVEGILNGKGRSG